MTDIKNTAGKKVLLAVNKAEGMAQSPLLGEFHELAPVEAAVREFREESGWRGRAVAVEPLYVYRDRAAGFVYHNFLLVLPGEFAPRLDLKETEEARWVRWGRWPTPLHFGLTRLVDDPASRAAIRRWVRRRAPA